MLQGNDQWGNGKILLLPTVIVNKHQYRGRLDVPSILRALCAGFSESTEPQVGRPPAAAALRAVLWHRHAQPPDLQPPDVHESHCDTQMQGATIIDAVNAEMLQRISDLCSVHI